MTEISQTNRIYLTYKARIIAEAKLRRYSALFNAIIVWYSFILLIASLAVTNDAITVRYYELLFASASIAIFASSVFLSTGILEKQANEFRTCYLEMQKIYGANSSVESKMKRYFDALDRYPNHSSRDDADLIFATWHRGGTLADTEGTIPFTFKKLAPTAIRKVAFWTAVASLFLAPLWAATKFIGTN
ncbi:SLATT domain-containing protein [Alteriqipengyuania lutimaris]|uniref:SLATT domain-containing protein n=1 Tax=Alteriqipengyuania lutimaris TaxID=1538146 RepID=UPI001CFF0C0F|nr:SLATT domain-containing protein [Alteriqipengyuania lutimaris]